MYLFVYHYRDNFQEKIINLKRYSKKILELNSCCRELLIDIIKFFLNQKQNIHENSCCSVRSLVLGDKHNSCSVYAESFIWYRTYDYSLTVSNEENYLVQFFLKKISSFIQTINERRVPVLTFGKYGNFPFCSFKSLMGRNFIIERGYLQVIYGVNNYKKICQVNADGSTHIRIVIICELPFVFMKYLNAFSKISQCICFCSCSVLIILLAADRRYIQFSYQEEMKPFFF